MPPIVPHTDSIINPNLLIAYSSGSGISLNINGNLYNSIATSSQLVNVSVNANGKISVAGTNIKLALLPSLTDTVLVSFYLTQ
jgi:hypothetical protein